LNSETKERLKSGMKSLEIDPFKSRSGSDVKKLKGTKKREDLYRLRARVSLREHEALFASLKRAVFGEVSILYFYF
jgi:hypothetical protein